MWIKIENVKSCVVNLYLVAGFRFVYKRIKKKIQNYLTSRKQNLNKKQNDSLELNNLKKKTCRVFKYLKLYFVVN